MVHIVNLDGQLADELAAVAAEAGCELIHAEFQGGALRLFLDRPEGVTLQDCETVSREISALLDATDFGRGRYTLEVSSPGLDRQLYTRADYERFAEHLVRVTHRDPQSRHKATIVGRLEKVATTIPANGSSGRADDDESADDNAEILVLETAAGGRDRRHRIALRDIEIARLEIEL